MKSPEKSYLSGLRRDVESAAKGYERTSKRVLELTADPGCEPGPQLVAAADEMVSAMKVYIKALRRLAHYAAHKGSCTSAAA